ncbi:MAG: AAA family ATPase [Woeseiaceae bacterium]|jgi:putative secretion ATPase (PEP-CTERM system associated)|nr:AAA family ATPase [Woeseiaceae bacterium]
MSYLEHFKFDKPPFGLSPDPDFVYWSKQHSRAKAYMESTIWLSDGFVVITGEIGSGKTTLLQSLLGELDDDVVYAVVSQTQLNATQFLQAILTEFGFKPFDKKKVELLDMINMFLIEQYSAGKKVILIVDEAQNLAPKVLEEVRLLSGIETNKEKVLRIILAGQPELRDTLESPKLKQLVQRVRLRFHLGALDQNDMREYIEHRLKVAGREDGSLFTEDAYPLIYRYSGGIPRLINTICDSALLVAFADDKTEIGPLEIENTAEELGWQEHEDTTGEHEVLPRLVTETPSKNYLTRIELVVDGEPSGEYLFEAGRVIIGRARDSEIHIDRKYVSRHHAQLVTSPEGCFVEDLNSTNGIQLNGTAVKKQLLNDGDTVSIDENEFIYHDLRSADDRDAVEDGEDTRAG